MLDVQEAKRQSTTAFELALRRAETLRLLAAKPRLTTREMDEAAGALGIRRAYIYKLLAAFRLHPRVSTLLPKTEGRRRGTRLVMPQVEAIVENAITSVYLQAPNPSFSALVRQVQIECRRVGLKPPDRKTIRLRVSIQDQSNYAGARVGTNGEKERITSVCRGPVITQALERVQIDHSVIDIAVVDEITRKPLGRPWLTLAIDTASRMVCGFYLSMMPPSAISVALALAHCVASKDHWLAEHELSFDWPASGIPDLVYMNDAKEFDPEALKSTALEYGIDVKLRPVGLRHFGGHIERLIGTTIGMAQLTLSPNLPDVGGGEGQTPAEAPVMTLSQLERWFAMQVNLYHSTIHPILKVAPSTEWKKTVSARDVPIRQLSVSGSRTFFLDLLPGERRKIRRDGIRLFNIRYWDNILKLAAGRTDAPVLVKFDPRDLSSIHFQDESGKYWLIPYRNTRAPAISLWEQRAAQSALHAQGKFPLNEVDLFSTVLKQRGAVANIYGVRPRISAS